MAKMIFNVDRAEATPGRMQVRVCASSYCTTSFGAEEMAPSVRCLSREHCNMGSDPQHGHAHTHTNSHALIYILDGLLCWMDLFCFSIFLR